MLSGALLLNKYYPPLTYFKKRFPRILIPFVFWVTMSFIYTVNTFHKKPTLDLFMNILLGKAGNYNAAFWFVSMIIIVYILIFAINMVIHYCSRRWKGFDKKFIYTLGLIGIIYIILYTLRIFMLGSLGLYFDYAGFIFYAIFGYILANMEFKFNKKVLLALTGVLFILFFGYYVCGYVVPTSISSGRFSPMFYFEGIIFLFTISLFLFFRFFEENNGKLYNKIANTTIKDWIVSFSLASFGIYLCHYMIFSMLQVHYFLQFDFANGNPLIWIPLLVFVTIVVSWTTIEVMSRIKYINVFSGK